MLSGDELVLMRASDLEDLVRRAVRDEIARSAPSDPAPEWLDRDGVAALLGYKPAYVSELVRHRGLPCTKVGRKMRFSRREVEAWISLNATPPEKVDSR